MNIMQYGGSKIVHTPANVAELKIILTNHGINYENKEDDTKSWDPIKNKNNKTVDDLFEEIASGELTLESDNGILFRILSNVFIFIEKNGKFLIEEKQHVIKSNTFKERSIVLAEKIKAGEVFAKCGSNQTSEVFAKCVSNQTSETLDVTAARALSEELNYNDYIVIDPKAFTTSINIKD